MKRRKKGSKELPCGHQVSEVNCLDEGLDSGSSFDSLDSHLLGYFLGLLTATISSEVNVHSNNTSDNFLN